MLWKLLLLKLNKPFENPLCDIENMLPKKLTNRQGVVSVLERFYSLCFFFPLRMMTKDFLDTFPTMTLQNELYHIWHITSLKRYLEEVCPKVLLKHVGRKRVGWSSYCREKADKDTDWQPQRQNLSKELGASMLRNKQNQIKWRL